MQIYLSTNIFHPDNCLTITWNELTIGRKRKCLKFKGEAMQGLD